MKAKEIRRKYIKFFLASPRNHLEINPAPLVLEEDPTTLFTSAGMQPLVPYLLGKNHPLGKRLVNSQPCLRLNDIDEVGDNRHTTFFEMLGNWSLGDYYKKEQLEWLYNFFTKELALEKERLWISVFGGSKDVPKDEESYDIWRKLGIPESRIYFYGVEKNWWSMTGVPKDMQVGHIGGPDSEVFYDFGEEINLHEKSSFRNKPCHPNCNCGRFLEIGNSVFIQYKKVSDESLEELPNKNVDFGGGLERITAVVNKDPDIFKIDLFNKTILNVEEAVGIKYGTSDKTDKNFRIISDHLRAAIILIGEGVVPSNKLHGYVVRRLIRRAIFHLKLLGFDFKKSKISDIGYPYTADFEIVRNSWSNIKEELNLEAVRFNYALERGLRKLEILIKDKKINGKSAFDLYQTEGLPLDLTLEILSERGILLNQNDIKIFKKEFEKHKDLSRTASSGIFKGGLADHSLRVIRFHTAAHILLASLRKLVNSKIVQKGQNITKERLRFDFSYSRKLTSEELESVEGLINKIIEKNLPVNFKIMSKKEALKTGAIHTFYEKYADTVKVYYIGGSIDKAFSKEFCGGPHVSKTGEIGRVKIKKQEKIGTEIVRVYITAENG